jgi:hypothetical protein
MKRSFRGLVLGVLLLTVSVLSLSTASSAEIEIGISVRIGPPALPVYAQPICPGPGYLWTPGYWAWSDADGYYWVPGTWVVAPVGMLWTPGYWGFTGGFYRWHAGYWGPHVGFYGGINYGFGYGGVGFAGGEWRGGAFFYNRAVMNVNVVNVRNVYTKTVFVNNVHTSFNGPGGIEARATRQEEEYGRERHTDALATQREHERAASLNRASFASENHGRPQIAATARPGEFSGRNLEKAREQSDGTRGFNQRARYGSVNDKNVSDKSMNERSNNDRSIKDRSINDRNERATEHNSKPPKQEKQDEKRQDKANRAQAKAEQKHNAREERR